jgi:hypothetical protein
MIIEVPTDELKKYSIFVGTPMYGGMCTGIYTKSTNDLSKLGLIHGVNINFYYLFNESLIQRARNYIVEKFLQSNCTHLMFIDSDIGFEAKDVLTLLALQISDPEKYDVLCGPYSKKVIDWENVKIAVENNLASKPSDLAMFAGDFAFNMKPTKEKSEFKIDQPFSVAEAGTGFMLIPRTVFEKYEEKFPEYKYIPDHQRSNDFNGSKEIMAYFDCIIDPISRRYLSEDYFFCKNCINIGINLHMCGWLHLTHAGTYMYRGSVAANSVLYNTIKSNENKENI